MLQMLRQAVRAAAGGSVEAGRRGRRAGGARGDRRRHGDRRGPHLGGRPGLLGGPVPGRADPGVRGPAAGAPDVHELGHGAGARPTWPACWSPRWSRTSCCTPPRHPARGTSSRLEAARARRRTRSAGWLGGCSPFAEATAAARPAARSSPCGCGAARAPSGSRCSTRTCGCRGSGPAGENDEGGRGLYLVDQLATRWGSRPTKDGKAVWFEIPLRGASASAAELRQRAQPVSELSGSRRPTSRARRSRSPR